MANDEILIKNYAALTGKWIYKTDKFYISGWFYSDPDKRQVEGIRFGNFSGKNIRTREPVYFEYKLFFESDECCLQLNRKKYRIKLIERSGEKAKMILVNEKGKEELWYWEEN